MNDLNIKNDPKSGRRSFFGSHDEVVAFLKQTHHVDQLFSIVSWGCSGTSWLAKVLNSHKEIMCLHDFPIGYCDIENRNPFAYMRSLYLTSYAYTLAGDIHGIPRESIPKIKKIYGNTFKTAILVRAPYPRLLSMLATVRLNHGLDNDFSYIDGLAERLNIGEVLTWEKRMFIHSVNMLNAIVDEKKYVGDIIFRMEDLIKSPDNLCQLIVHISEGKIKPDEKWLVDALLIPPAHSHRDQYEEAIVLTDEEKELIPVILSDQAIKEYESLNYDVSKLLPTY
jgi:hypothetical protein